MIIKQASVFIENKPGRLAEITGIIAENNINMRAASLAETANSGILRIIADDPDKVEEVLRERGVTASIKKVISVLVGDEAGGLAEMLKILADNGIAIKYMYAFAVKGGKACIIMRVGDEETDKAAGILEKAGYGGLKTE